MAIHGENRIAIFAVDESSGKLKAQESFTLMGGPGPLAVNPGQRTLYVGLRSNCRLASLRIDCESGGLTHLGTIALRSDPCYLSVDKTGRYVLSAYYGAGAVAVHEVSGNGALTEQPVVWRGTKRYSHAIEVDSQNRFAFVPQVEKSNCILQFKFDESSGGLKPNKPRKLKAAAGMGPRHCCFHPVLDWVYVNNEQGSSVTAYHLNRATGTLKSFQTVSTLPAEFAGVNSCAQIRIHPTGKFLYISNRGHDSVACLSVDQSSGRLTALDWQLTDPVPRAFNLDQDGRYLFVASQELGNLAHYEVDQVTGRLAFVDSLHVGQTPLWIVVLNLP